MRYNNYTIYFPISSNRNSYLNVLASSPKDPVAVEELIPLRAVSTSSLVMGAASLNYASGDNYLYLDKKSAGNAAQELDRLKNYLKWADTAGNGTCKGSKEIGLPNSRINDNTPLEPL